MKLFLSHRETFKQQTELYANGLRRCGFEPFVAHADIGGGVEWKNALQGELDNCEALIALYSQDFSESQWTDQEIGWALARKVPVLPCSLDGTTAYGFPGDHQCVDLRKSWGSREPVADREAAALIVDGLYTIAPRIRDSIGTALSTGLINASSFIASIDTSKLIERYFANGLSATMRHNIERSLGNDQVSGATGVSDRLMRLLESDG